MIRSISIEKAKKSYNSLVEYECDDTKLGGLVRVGLPTLDYFLLSQRLKVRTKRGISFWEAMNDSVKVKKLREIVKRWNRDKKGGKGTTETSRLYYAFQLWYGTVNQFRPAFAKLLYCELGAKRGILDFSSGWGGRCLAAMSLGIPYYGFDANKELRGGYTKMIKSLGDKDTKVEMKWGPSENVDFKQYRGKYDLICTSPPYFTLEQYRGMPKYGSQQGFLDIFFKPVVKNVWKHLIRGGRMALNMPVEMYDAIKDELPKIEKTIQMPIQSRGGKQGGSSELVYIWHKRS
jgi:hypothetical protein